MPERRHPTDVVADDLLATYNRGIRRLEGHVATALERGLDPSRAYTPAARRGDATAAYRQRQLTEARDIVRGLRTLGPRHASGTVGRAYRATALGVDRALGKNVGALGAFGGVQAGAVEALAGNLGASLERAAATVGDNIEQVFERAAALDGALDPRATPSRRFIGRRVDDPWRRVALEELGAGQVSGDVRRQVSASLRRRLIDEGVTDAVTGFVDRAGRRWPLDRYAAMVTRTTTREATSRATIDRLDEHGLDLVTVSSHAHANDICTPYDGQTFTRGHDKRYPELDQLPPFHPYCRHVLTPADVGLEDLERELGLASRETVGEGRGRTPAGGTPTAAAKGGAAQVDRLDAELELNEQRLATAARGTGPLERRSNKINRELEDVRGLDPGPFEGGAPGIGDLSRRRLHAEQIVDDLPDPVELEARIAHMEDLAHTVKANELERATAAELEGAGQAELRAEAKVKAAKARKRAESKLRREQEQAIDQALGPDVVAALKDLADAGAKWAGEHDLKEALIAGDVDLDEIVGRAEAELGAAWARRVDREALADDRGYESKPIPCFVCGRFKRRPADVCGHCGDDPVTHHGNAGDLNEAYGYRRDLSDRHGGLDERVDPLGG